MTRAMTPNPAPAPAPRPAGGPPPQRPRPTGPTIDPVRVLRQNVWRIVVTAVVGAALGVGLTYFFNAVYPLWSAKVMFEIKSQLESANDLNAKDIITEDTVVRLAQTEVARLISKDNLNKAMDRPEVLKTAWADGYRDSKGVFVKEEAVLDLEDELRSGHQRGTQIFFLSWNAHVPEDAPTVLNAIADTYVRTRHDADDSRFTNFRAIYEGKRDQIEQQIADKKKAIQDFIRKENLTSLTEGNSENQRTLEKLRDDIAQQMSEMSSAKARLAQVEKKINNKSGVSDEDLRRAQDDPVLLPLQRDFEDAKKRFEGIKARYGEVHPDFQLGQADLAAAQAAFERKRDEVLNRNLLADYKEAQNRVEALDAVVKKQNEDLVKYVKEVEDFTSSMAEMRTLQDQLEVLQERRKEVAKTLQDVSLALLREERNRVDVVQKAIRPREITFPQFKYMIPVTAVLLTALYVLVLFVRELLDQRVKYPSDMMAMPGKLLGVVPDLDGDPAKLKRIEGVVREAPQSITAESVRQLSAQVNKSLLANGCKTVMVLGAMPEAGATSLSLNVAMCEAAVGRKVLLIGANMRRPGLSRALGKPLGSPGLGEVLAGEDPANTVMEVQPGLDMIPVGAPASRVLERLNTVRMDEVLAWAKERYDLVLVDAPPSVVASESLIIANKVDAAIVVARAWKDQRGLIMKLCGQLLDSRCQLLGVVLNRMRMTAGGYLRKNAEAMADYAERTAAFGGTDEIERKKKERRKAVKKPA